MRLISKHLALAGLLAGLVGTAQATPTLFLSDGTTNITVTDGGVGDVFGAPGTVTFAGAIGGWSVNVTTGVVLSGGSSPAIDINSINVSSTGGGTLSLWFSEGGFGPNLGNSAAASFGGTTTGTVTFSTAWNSANILGSGSFLTSPVSFSAGLLPVIGFSTNLTSAPIYSEGSYSLTEFVTITHKGAGATSFDAYLKVPDGGTTAALLGSGLIGVALVGYRRKRAVS